MTEAENCKCSSCGAIIPATVPGEALCVACRYGGSYKPPEAIAPTEYEVALEQTPARTPCPEPEVELLLRLEDAGAEFADRGRAVEVIRGAFDDFGDRRAADCVCRILARLPGGRRGTELRLALVGGNMAEEARRLGIAPQILHRSVARLRKRMIPTTLMGAVAPKNERQ